MATRFTPLAASLAFASCAARHAPTPAPPLPPAVEAWLRLPQDRDGDLVPDDLDGCPEAPEDRDGVDDGDGCPDPDNDRDRIVDTVDDCLNDPEVYNGLDDHVGCPDEGAKMLVGGPESRGLPVPVLVFAVGSSEWAAEPHNVEVITTIAAVLRDYPEVDQVVVEGHADVRAERRRALALSRTRAEAVVAALAARGVPSERLVAIGFGALCPIDPRRTADADARNRRVSFVDTRVNGQRTLRAVGCPRCRRYIPSGVGLPRRAE